MDSSRAPFFLIIIHYLFSIYSTFITVLHLYYQPGKPVVDYLIKVRLAIVCFRRIIINEKFKKPTLLSLLLILLLDIHGFQSFKILDSIRLNRNQKDFHTRRTTGGPRKLSVLLCSRQYMRYSSPIPK